MIKLFSIRNFSRVIAVLSFVAAGGATAFAEVSVGTEARFRSFYSNNLTDANDDDDDVCPASDGTLDQSCDDQEGFHDVRLRVKMTASQGVGAGVAVVDVFSREGRDVATLSTSSGTVETGNWRLGSQGPGGGLTTLLVREAYLRVTLPFLTAQAGRQAVHFGHGLVLDDTLDAITLAFPAGPVGIAFGAAKLTESDDSVGAAIDTDLYFAHLSWTPRAAIVTTLFVAVLQDRGPNLTMNGICQSGAGVPPAFESCPVSDLGDDEMILNTAGWTLDIKKERYRIGLEANLLLGKIKTGDATALNPDGEDLDLAGINGLIELEWVFPFLRAGITGLYATGQDSEDFDDLNINAISPNYVLGNILVNNEMDSDRDGGSVGGLTAVRLALERQVWRELEGELAVIWARMTERPAPGIDRDLGWEIDLNGSFPLDDHLIWLAGVGYLFSGEAWEGIYGDPDADDDQIKAFSKFIFTY